MLIPLGNGKIQLYIAPSCLSTDESCSQIYQEINVLALTGIAQNIFSSHSAVTEKFYWCIHLILLFLAAISYIPIIYLYSAFKDFLYPQLLASKYDFFFFKLAEDVTIISHLYRSICVPCIAVIFHLRSGQITLKWVLDRSEETSDHVSAEHFNTCLKCVFTP